MKQVLEKLNRPPFWAALCAAEATVILCLCFVFTLKTTAPPRVDTPVLTSAVWSEEKQSFAESNPYYQEREALFTRFCEGPVDLCCLGDSITQKFEWQGALSGWTVANRGIGSDTTEGMLARLDSVIMLEPRAISLMAGVNDLSLGRTPEEIIETYRALLDEILLYLPDVEIIVNSVLPVTVYNGVNSEDIQALNLLLKDLCKEREIPYLDMFWSFADESGNLLPGYAIDSVHLSPDGFALWLSYLEPAVSAALR